MLGNCVTYHGSVHQNNALIYCSLPVINTKASMFLKITKEEFEDTKVAIRIRKTSIKDLTY